MTTPLVTFGDPAKFEIAARWSADAEPRERLPLVEGWSTGEFRITVCGQVLTAHRIHGQTRDALSWYLSPLIDWLITQWVWLLHEEGYPWQDKYGQPAAMAAGQALHRALHGVELADSTPYEAVHAWWTRHALRACDASAAYPDIFLRRVADDIEVSWLPTQPDYAPESFSLALAAGSALLPVQAVASPLWAFLQWAVETAPPVTAADRQVVAALAARLEALRSTALTQLEQAHVGQRMQAMLERARSAAHACSQSTLARGEPVIESLDSAVLMFGGTHVNLIQADVNSLFTFMASRAGGADTPELAELVSAAETDPWLPPFEEGYRLADQCREALGLPEGHVPVDMENVLDRLGISVVYAPLETPSIRGVAVAGAGYAPAILVNTHSVFNQNEPGRRFTLAHELCHILHDRTRARKLSHLSGPWSAPRTEKRANAFAPMFLAPPAAIRPHWSGELSNSALRALAQRVGISPSAMVEHLHNVDMINDAEREALRQG